MNTFQACYNILSEISEWIVQHPLAQILLPALITYAVRISTQPHALSLPFSVGQALQSEIKSNKDHQNWRVLTMGGTIMPIAEAPNLAMAIQPAFIEPAEEIPHIQPCNSVVVAKKHSRFAAFTLLNPLMYLVLVSCILLLVGVHTYGFTLIAGMSLGTLSILGIVGLIQLALGNTLSHADMDGIDHMSGERFEIYLVNLFRNLGYEVRHTGRLGDYGGDLLIRNGEGSTIVQAKRYTGYVGLEAVQQVIGARGYYKADKALVVTNSTFSTQARNLARSNGVKMWDRQMLMRAMRNAKQQPDVDWLKAIPSGFNFILVGAALLLKEVMEVLFTSPKKNRRYYQGFHKY